MICYMARVGSILFKKSLIKMGNIHFVENHFVKNHNRWLLTQWWSLSQMYLWHFYLWSRKLQDLWGTSEVLVDESTDSRLTSFKELSLFMFWFAYHCWTNLLYLYFITTNLKNKAFIQLIKKKLSRILFQIDVKLFAIIKKINVSIKCAIKFFIICTLVYKNGLNSVAYIFT